MSGLFIVLEGTEGSGKSTQVRMLGEWLSTHGIRHRLTREPGGTAVGEELRAVMLHGGDIGAETELLVALAARAAHVRGVIQPALAAGEVVVCDRYELSTFAYQGLARGLDLKEVKSLNAFATGGLKPDLTVVLDVPAREGEARRSRSRPEFDRIERAGIDFHDRVAEAYRLLASGEPAVVLVDGRAAPEAVHAEILKLLQGRFSETFPSKAG